MEKILGLRERSIPFLCGRAAQRVPRTLKNIVLGRESLVFDTARYQREIK
jgi:hypothetical protein